MTQEIYRLVYYSRSRLPGDAKAAGAEIDAILVASRKHNRGAGVTGALLFSAGGFGQVLEGSRRAVEATFERIQRDPRHGEVSLLAFEVVAERAFSNWSMAFIGEARVGRRYDDIATRTGFDPSRLSADRMFEVLRQLTLEEEAEIELSAG